MTGQSRCIAITVVAGTLLVGCGDQSQAVRSSATDWGKIALRHVGHPAERLTCATPGGDSTDTRFRVSCTGQTTDGETVRLTADAAEIDESRQRGHPQYLSGPWTMTIGGSTRTLTCLPSSWQPQVQC